MAQQESLIKLKGRIGDLTFYKTKDGYLARGKGGVNAERIAKDPRFQRTRENATEFGRAGSATKRMRNVLRSIILQSSDSRMSNRLTSRLLRVIKADTVNHRGLRKVLGSNAHLLNRFNFNAHAPLNDTFFVDIRTRIDHAKDAFSITIPAFNPMVAINCPAKTSYFQFISAAASIDFEGNESALTSRQTERFPVTKPVDTIQFDIDLPAVSAQPLFLIFGILFFQDFNFGPYPIENGKFNPLAIITVNYE